MDKKIYLDRVEYFVISQDKHKLTTYVVTFERAAKRLTLSIKSHFQGDDKDTLLTQDGVTDLNDTSAVLTVTLYLMGAIG